MKFSSPSIQFPENELAGLLDAAVPYVKKNRASSAILYILFLIYFSFPSFNVPLLQYGHFRITALMEQRALEHNLKFYPEQSWIGINDVNPMLLKGIISMEDQSFFEHKGIDWVQLNKALKENKRRGRVIRGGSTITMQLAKNMYLTTKRNVFRKAKELIITFRMEKELTKKEILQDYINAVEWGSRIFGIREAAEIYFHKEPANLTRTECARLAAVIPSPLKHSPVQNSGYVMRRTSIILGRMNSVVLYPKKL